MPRKKIGSGAHNRAVTKYCAKAYDRILLRLYKGQRELVKAKADSLGMSVNSYIISLLAKEIPGIERSTESSGEEVVGTDNNV